MRRLVLHSAWLALLDALRPRMLALALLPLAVAGVSAWLVQALFWDRWIAALQVWVQGRAWLLDLLQGLGWTQAAHGLAAAILIALGVPALILLTLLLVAVIVMPAASRGVARRRFAQLQPRDNGYQAQSLMWSAWITVAGLAMLVLSLPLWFIPLAGLLIPPIIWGWMTAMMFGFDALGPYACPGERRQLLREHRWTLLGMGVASGYLSTLPTLLLTAGWLALALLPVLALLSLWLYVLAFAFTSLWFAHYLLAGLVDLRRRAGTQQGQAD
jgi:hypothetical protein